MSTDHQEQSDLTPTTPTAEETPILAQEPVVEAPASETIPATPEPVVVPTTRLKVADTDAYAAELAKALAAPENPPGEPPVEDQVPVETITPPSEEVVTEPAATEIPVTPATEEDDTLPPAESGRAFRPRLSKLDRTQQEAILLVKELKDKGQNISLAEAESRVNAKYGITTETVTPTTPVTPEKTEAEIQVKIEELNKQRAIHAENLDVVELEKVRDQIDALKEEQREIKASRIAKAKEVENEIPTRVDAAHARALAKYPDAANPESAIAKKANELWDLYRDANAPIIFDPEAIEKVYDKAAELLAKSGTPTQATAKAPVSATPKPPVVPQQAVRRTTAVPVASGGERTTTPAPTTEPFGKIRNADDYAKIVRGLGANI